MKLTQDQIQELYSFTRKHYVEHYDLQTELVDHLANGIEAQWKEHPERSYKDARLREFRKFGVHGFEKVVNKRKRAMQWRYWKIIFRFYREYFRLPKVILILILTLLLTISFNLVPLANRYDFIILFFFAIVSVLFFLHFKNRKNNELDMVQYGKKWMLKDLIYTYGNITSIVNLVPVTLNLEYFRNRIPIDSAYVLMTFAFLTVCVGLLSYVTIFIIPRKAEELLTETYPEYKMVS